MECLKKINELGKNRTRISRVISGINEFKKGY
jgi:hypothetical protein